MARFNIVSANGQVVRYSGKPKYNGVFGGVSYLEFAQIASPTLIDFHVGDYVDYSRTGFRYKLYSVPKPTKRSGNNTAGDTYVYKNVQFHCATKDAELAPFRDLVLNDNLIHFTTLPTISVYDDVYGIADRIQACMDDYAGTGVWNITVMNTSDPVVLAKLHEEKEFSVSGISCLGALEEIYRLWSGIGWVYSVFNGVNTITIGRPNVQDSGNTTDVFSYGEGNGLTVIAQAVSDKNDMATRLYVYGSDRNMPPRYYNNVTPAIYSAESVYIPNLMIPLSYWGSTSNKKDARKAYVEDATAISKYGLIPKTIYFNGSGEYEEIYPSLEGVTFAELRAAMGSGAEYYPSPSRYPNGDYVNTIKAVVNPTDNGIIEEDGARYLESGSVAVPAILDTFPYVSGQFVVNCTPGGELAAYTVEHGGFLKITSDLAFSVECQEAVEVKANFVVVVNGEGKQIIPAPVTASRTDWSFVFPSIRQKVEPDDEVSVFVGVDVRFLGSQAGGNVVISANAATVDFNLQYSISDTFSVTLKQIGFDISKQGGVLSDGLATLSMKSGMCGGREFVIKSCTYDSLQDQWELECYRQKDDALGQYFPNSIYPMAAEDSYVLVDIMMPELYVQASEARLYERALQVLVQMSKPKIIYTPEIDAKVLALNPATILEGMYMPVYDENLIPTTVQAYPHTTWVLISSLVIAEDEYAIPTYKVTLQDEKADSFIQTLTNQMNENAKRIRKEEEDASRSAYIAGAEEEVIPAVPYVEILSSAEFFTYASGSATPIEGTIILQAVPHDIPDPSYQWYYNGLSGWTALSGATGQTYEVDPDSSVYYASDDNVAEFKVVVTVGGASYDAYKTIVKLKSGEGADGLTIMLSNPARVFNATADGYAIAATDTVYIYGFRGTTRLATTIGTITGTVMGLNASKMNNGTTSAAVIVSASASLNQGGSLAIPVTVDGTTVNLRYSWSLSPKGDKGDPGSQGVQGKAPRGPSDYDANTQYSGIEGNGNFIDYVFNANRTKMYVCIKTPPVGTPLTNTTYWQESTIQDFVATKLFYATYGYVQNLGANAVKASDTNGNIFGGFMPPDTPNEYNGDYVFWTGGATPGLATVKMHRNGTGYFGPYSLGPDGFEYSVSNSNYSKTVNLTLDDLYLYYAQQGSVGYARIRPRLGDAILELFQDGNLAALNKPGIKITASGSGKAISVPQGVYEGLRPSIKVATSLETLTDLDHTVIIPETITSSADIYLPTSPMNGQEYVIINYSSYSAGVGYSGTATHKIKMLSTSSTTGANNVTLTTRRVLHLVYSSSYGHWIGWYDL